MDWSATCEFALDLFQRLIRCNTTNYGGEIGGDEREAVKLLEEVFKSENIDYSIVAMEPKRPNIIARLSSDKSGGGAILLSAHLDVVPAPENDWKTQGWKHSPFSGHYDSDDECIYGRGAIDMKHHAAMSVAIMVQFKRNNIALTRDIIFAGVADEEDGSHKGAEYLVREHPNLIEADLMLTEMGGFPYFAGEGADPCFPVQISEKGYCNLELTAYGIGGHSSMIHKDNAIGFMGMIAHRVSQHRLPLHVTQQVRPSFSIIARSLPFPKSLIFRSLLQQMTHNIILDHMLPTQTAKTLAPILHNTAVPTISSAGVKDNTVPTFAKLLLNCRILPGFSPEDVMEEVQALIGQQYFIGNIDSADRNNWPRLSIRFQEGRSRSPAVVQDPDDPRIKHLLKVIQDAIDAQGPSGSVFPMLLPGATDARCYTNHPCRMLCIGFSPVFLPRDIKFSTLFHGSNERVPKQGFLWGIELLKRVISSYVIASSTKENALK